MDCRHNHSPATMAHIYFRKPISAEVQRSLMTAPESSVRGLEEKLVETHLHLLRGGSAGHLCPSDLPFDLGQLGKLILHLY